VDVHAARVALDTHGQRSALGDESSEAVGQRARRGRVCREDTDVGELDVRHIDGQVHTPHAAPTSGRDDVLARSMRGATRTSLARSLEARPSRDGVEREPLVPLFEVAGDGDGARDPMIAALEGDE
jgi:hypothetical protein